MRGSPSPRVGTALLARPQPGGAAPFLRSRGPVAERRGFSVALEGPPRGRPDAAHLRTAAPAAPARPLRGGPGGAGLGDPRAERGSAFTPSRRCRPLPLPDAAGFAFAPQPGPKPAPGGPGTGGAARRPGNPPQPGTEPPPRDPNPTPRCGAAPPAEPPVCAPLPSPALPSTPAWGAPSAPHRCRSHWAGGAGHGPAALAPPPRAPHGPEPARGAGARR